MLRLLISLFVVVYIVGAVAIFALHTQMPVTLGLATLRSALWPVWVITGHPKGAPMYSNDGDG